MPLIPELLDPKAQGHTHGNTELTPATLLSQAWPLSPSLLTKSFTSPSSSPVVSEASLTTGP